MIRVCFVCLGNICRSPTAEGVMRHLLTEAGLADQVAVDSAGTSAYHRGEPPDRRSAAAAARRGITLAGASRQVTLDDFDTFDLIVGMDQQNMAALGQMVRSPADREKLHTLRSFDPDSPPGADVPDPYFGGPDGFSVVVDICEAGCRGLLAHIQGRLGG